MKFEDVVTGDVLYLKISNDFFILFVTQISNGEIKGPIFKDENYYSGWAVLSFEDFTKIFPKTMHYTKMQFCVEYYDRVSQASLQEKKDIIAYLFKR